MKKKLKYVINKFKHYLSTSPIFMSILPNVTNKSPNKVPTSMSLSRVKLINDDDLTCHLYGEIDPSDTR